MRLVWIAVTDAWRLLLGQVAIVLSGAGFSTVTLFPELYRRWAIGVSVALLVVGLILTIWSVTHRIRRDLRFARRAVLLEHLFHGDLEIRKLLTRELLFLRDNRLPQDWRQLVFDACLVTGSMRAYTEGTPYLALDMTAGVFPPWTAVFSSPLADQPVTLPRHPTEGSSAFRQYAVAYRSDRVDLTLVVVFAVDLEEKDPALNLVASTFRNALHGTDLQAALTRRSGTSCIDLERELDLMIGQ